MLLNCPQVGIFWTFSLLALWSHIRAMTTNPGKIINLRKLPSCRYLKFTVFHSLTSMMTTCHNHNVCAQVQSQWRHTMCDILVKMSLEALFSV